MKKYLRAIGLLCGQVFIPQWGKRPKDYGQDGYLEELLAKQGGKQGNIDNRDSCRCEPGEKVERKVY